MIMIQKTHQYQIKVLKYLFIPFTILIMTINASATGSLDPPDIPFQTETALGSDFDLFGSDTENQKQRHYVSINGYIESENYLTVENRFQENEDVDKSEAHIKLNVSANIGPLSFNSTIHSYGYPDEGAVTKEGYDEKMIITEGYISYTGEHIDIKAGRQMIKWGTADSVNPTSYFNPIDLSEMLLKGADEIFIGVYALQGTLLWGNSSLKMVVTPSHTKPILPEENAPWHLGWTPVPVDLTNLMDMEISLPVTRRKKSESLKGSKNIGTGFRFASNLTGMDYSFSMYHGPDRDVILKPERYIDIQNPDTSTVIMKPVYDSITSAGGDFALSSGNITWQMEASYTFDKPAVPDPFKQEITDEGIKKTGFLLYAVGGTLITDSDYTIIFEYIDSFYTKEEEKFIAPFFQNIISLNTMKTICSGSLNLNLMLLYDPAEHGALILPEIGWDFQNGACITLAAAIFEGNKSSLFGSYDDKDLISLSFKYHF